MNFQKKYLKYKLKYNQLKNQLKGGACDPVPIPTDNEYISLEQYQNIPVNRLETIGGHCYDIVGLANWVHLSEVSRYPATNLPMSLNDIWNVITAYNAYRTAHNPDLPNHFVYTPAQSVQIIYALNNPPVPIDITNLINNIKRGIVAPVAFDALVAHDALVALNALFAPPIGYINPVITPTPAQIILLNNLIPIAPAALVPGTRYIAYDTLGESYYRTRPFMNVVMDDDVGSYGYVRFDAGDGSTILSNPALHRYYNIADLVPNGLPLPP